MPDRSQPAAALAVGSAEEEIRRLQEQVNEQHARLMGYEGSEDSSGKPKKKKKKKKVAFVDEEAAAEEDAGKGDPTPSKWLSQPPTKRTGCWQSGRLVNEPEWRPWVLPFSPGRTRNSGRRRLLGA